MSKDIKTIEDIEGHLGKNFKSWVDDKGSITLISNKEYLERMSTVWIKVDPDKKETK